MYTVHAVTEDELQDELQGSQIGTMQLLKMQLQALHVVMSLACI